MRKFEQLSRAAGAAATAALPATSTGKTAPAAPPTSAAGDTEVAIGETPSAAKAGASSSKSTAEPAQTVGPTGRLLVRSTPAGALVAIDGKPVGRTPLTARDLSLAPHTVVVSKPGFTSETRRVSLAGRGAASSVTVTLEAERPARPAPAARTAATTGSVNVDSRPRGAQVTIDGRAVGMTPLNAPGLTPGVHTVRVELAGHKPVATKVTVKAGETARIAVTLEQR